MRRPLLALAGALLLAALPAHAATVAQRAGTSGPSPITGPCAVQNAGIKPYLCADFRHGIYVLNGGRYASFAAMGGSNTGSCTFSLGTGLSCPSTAFLSIPLTHSAGGYMLVVDANPSTSQAATAIAKFDDGTHYIQSLQQTTNRSAFGFAGQGCIVAAGSGITAAYVVSSASYICSTFGGAAATIAATMPAANTGLTIGGNSSASQSVSSPSYVRSVRVYFGTFTTGQVQTAAAQ